MSCYRANDSAWLILELHRKSCAFASFRQGAAKKIKALSDELGACKNELQLTQDEIDYINWQTYINNQLKISNCTTAIRESAVTTGTQPTKRWTESVSMPDE